MSSSQPPNPTPAPLELDQGPLTPDQTLARAAQQALAAYLADVKAGRVAPSLARNVVESLPPPAEPRLDAGYWRLGAWLLESRSGTLALTHRPVQPQPQFEYVAALRGDRRRLEVATLTMRQLHARR
jgi:hypothetical protein